MKEVRWGEVHGGIKRYKVNKAGVLWGGIRFVRFKVFFVSITMYFLLITILKLIFWVNDFSHKNIGIRYQYLLAENLGDISFKLKIHLVAKFQIINKSKITPFHGNIWEVSRNFGHVYHFKIGSQATYYVLSIFWTI